MTHLRDVKMIRERTFAEFEPMKNAILLLKKHGVKMDEGLLVQIENSKTALDEVSTNALGPVKESILPLQNKEAGNIKQRLSDFLKKVLEYRQEFQKFLPYHTETSNPEIINKAYETIASYYEKTLEIEEEAKDLNNLETLFDLQKSSYKQLKDCKNELLSLKYMTSVNSVTT